MVWAATGLRCGLSDDGEAAHRLRGETNDLRWLQDGHCAAERVGATRTPVCGRL